MAFNSIKVFQFRNLENTEINFSEMDIYFVGKNGQGKTNILEAVYLLCVGSSFRTRNDSVLVKNDFKDMSLSGVFDDSGFKRRIQLKLEEGKKSILIDGKKISDRKELISDFPCIAFTHDDINFVNGPPGTRRRFINQTISLYDSLYIDSLRVYNHVIKLRNRLLKERKTDLLDLYDKQAADAGIYIQKKRKALVEEYNSTFSELYRKISGDEVSLHVHYSPSWKCELETEKVCSHFKSTRNRDLLYGTTTTGPHRDRIGFYEGGKNFTITASTGQIRLISLSLRASQAAFIASKSGKKPILLLDDVLLEMDLDKRKRFLNHLPGYKQAFFTFLPDEGLVDYKKNGPLYRVSGGIISRQN